MTPTEIDKALDGVLIPCPECNDKRRVHSGVMIVHPQPVLPPILGVARAVGAWTPKSKPILMVHPTIYERLKPMLTDAADTTEVGPKDQLVRSMIRAGELRVEVSEHVPLWIDCRTCCAPVAPVDA